jgi:hypothetical protein
LSETETSAICRAHSSMYFTSAAEPTWFSHI